MPAARLAAALLLLLLVAAAPATASPRAAARAALEARGADPQAFRFEHVRRSPVGTHVRGREVRDGVPVARTHVVVSLLDGRAIVRARRSALPGRPAPEPLGARAARAAALGALGVALPARVHAERLLAPRRGRLVDVHRVTVLSLRPGLAREVDVSARTGRVLAVRDGTRRADAHALLYDPNPMVALRDPALRQPGLDTGAGADTDVDDPRLNSARVVLPIREYDERLTPAGRLTGPWASVQGGQPYVAQESTFDLTRGMPGFEGLMAYAHVDAIQRHFQALGMRDVNAEPQDVIAHRVEGFDNSFYQPGTDVIALGAGGVDDGEDAEVIIHEYGHAVQDAQVPGWGQTTEGGAMGEGFGDFLAATYFAPVSGGFQDECVAEWDATSYSDATPPCLRRLDSPKVYPRDTTGSVHADGEIWSAFLWRIRAAVGTTTAERSDNALRLVLASHELMTPAAEFRDGVTALRTAAAALGRPDWIAAVDASAVQAGFMPPPPAPEPPPASPPAAVRPTSEPERGAQRTRIACRRRPRPACRISGRRPAGARGARLVRGGRTYARGRVRGRAIRLRAVRPLRSGRYRLVLRDGSRVVLKRRVRLR
ncbi:MAG TPA: M36 family metallopeptidase [Solirubrobacteraceae bacterium]|nr:M36 family metallopeptidase [Solirubrobacteraceae bacterium]